MPKISENWVREVLNVFYQRRTAMRSDVVQATKLNVASVSHALQFLVNRGVVLKVGEIRSTVGRRRHLLKLNPDTGYFVAVDLEGTHIRFALTNFSGDVQYRWEENIELGKNLSAEKVASGIKIVVGSMKAEQRKRLLSVGISHPGLVDDAGRITAFNLGWNNLPLLDELQRLIRLPIALEPASRTCVFAERGIGCAQESDNFAYVHLGQGIGVGLFVDGRVLCGGRHMAGELGHITVDPNAKDLCCCGKRGCLESVASSPNIVRQYLLKTGRSVKHLTGSRVTEIFERARSKDTAAIEVLDRAARALGLALSAMVNLLNPRLIVFGGDMILGEDVYLPRVKAELLRHALPEHSKSLVIKISSLGLDVGLKGASSLAFRHSLADRNLLMKLCTPLNETLARVAEGRRL